MKWFFGLNEQSSVFEDYSKMLKVAVKTAQKFTSLEPHFLYDGEENSLTKWLTERNVRIIKRRSFLYSQLAEIAEKRNDRNYLTIGSGAFLRTEIPQVSLEENFDDEYVLYTDIDVMFQKDVTELEKLRPKYFAVAPEFDRRKYKEMNSGVMLMNLKNLREVDEKFRRFMSDEIEMLVNNTWDQTAYRVYFKTFYGGYKWSKLPIEFNWKTYWGKNDSAPIIHFHGPKPTQRDLLFSDKCPKEIEVLRPLADENYQYYCDEWNKYCE